MRWTERFYFKCTVNSVIRASRIFEYGLHWNGSCWVIKL